MKRFGKIMFCFLPALLAFGIQQLLSFPAVAIALLRILYSDSVSNMDDLILAYNKAITSSSFSCAVLIMYGIAALIIFGFWYRKKFITHFSLPTASNFNFPIIAGLIMTAVGLQYVSNYIVSITAAIHPAWLDTYTKLLESVGFDDVSVVLAAYSVLVAPICEELIFRGVTMHYAKRAMPFVLANIFQALLFGIYHMNVLQGVYAFFVGLILGYICEKGGSIILAILFHICFNIWGTFAPEWFMYGADQAFFFILWFLVGMVLLVCGILLFKHGIQKRDEIVNYSSASSDM